ncbi:MAG: hypothetical protein AABY22_12060 [Nanoarchaeota archaeon]
MTKQNPEDMQDEIADLKEQLDKEIEAGFAVGEKCVHLQKQLEDKDIQIEDLTLLIKNESKIVTALDEVRTGKFYCVDDEGNFVRPEIRIHQLEKQLGEKDKEIEGLTKQLLQSRKEINEMKQDKKKLLDEVENIIDKFKLKIYEIRRSKRVI